MFEAGSAQPVALDAEALKGRPLRYFDFVMAAFVTILLLSNVLGAGKVAVVDLPGIGNWPFGAGILFFPIGYVLGDILTEVYGYARARRCIWAGTVALLFMAFMSWVVVELPPALIVLAVIAMGLVAIRVLRKNIGKQWRDALLSSTGSL